MSGKLLSPIAENLTKEREKLDRYDYRIPIHSNRANQRKFWLIKCTKCVFRQRFFNRHLTTKKSAL